MKLVFVDTETTGLDPDRHHIWELAIIVRGDDGDTEHVLQLPADLSTADPAALRIGRFYDRHQWPETGEGVREAAAMAARMLDGATLIGAVPSFDAAFVDRWLRTNGQCPTWHHRLRCVETLTAAHLHRPDLGGLAECCEALGIVNAAEHTALGDARAARDIWDAVMGS